MRRRPLLLLCLLLLIVAAVVFGFARRGPRPTEVDVDRVVRRQPFRSWVTASGEIVAARYADIGSSVMGRLVALPVREGDRVVAGQVLARIDAVPAETETRAAEASLQALEADRAAAIAAESESARSLERARALREQGLTPQSELDAALAAADSARARREAAEKRIAEGRARLASARDRLAKTEITAPMDGVVTRLAAREGEMVVVGVQNQPGTILMTLSDLSSIDAEVEVAEADVMRLAVGQPATAKLEALPGREFAGRVIEIGASALPLAGTAAAAREFRVVVRLEPAGAELRPGLTCDVAILAEERADALTVPLQAVTLRAAESGAERTGVFLVEAGRARFTPVETGIVGGLDIEVRGVAEGATLVVGPYAALRQLADGAPVRPRVPAS